MEMAKIERPKKPIAGRLLALTKVSDAGCWPFRGATLKSGYGKISVSRGKPAFAHRVSYEQFVGSIPPGQNVLHRCDNPRCVNPQHLFLGTQKDNWLDARAKGRNYPSPQQTPNYRHWRSKVDRNRRHG